MSSREICDYSAILDPDWFEEMEITKPWGETDPDLYEPIDYKDWGQTPYVNGFLGNSAETLYKDLNSGDYILRIAESVPVGDYSVSWVYRWFKSTEGGRGEVEKAMEEWARRAGHENG